MSRRETRPDLDAVVAAINARCDRWQALLPLRDLLKSQPDATWAPGELEEAGYGHALRVLANAPVSASNPYGRGGRL